MLRLKTVIFISLAALTLLAMAPAQTDMPPPSTPTPDPIDICISEGLAKCIIPATRSYGLWALAGLLLFGFLLWIFTQYFKGIGRGIEELGKDDSKRLFSKGEFNNLTQAYLEKVIEDYRRFTLRGVGERARDIAPPELDQAYVSLRLISTAKERAKRIESQSKLSGKDFRLAAEGEQFQPGTEAVGLEQSLNEKPRLAIIGAAGSGKTTLLQWVGLAMARVLLGKKRLLKPDQAVLIAKLERPLLPIFIPLREYNRYCIENKFSRSARSLTEFMAIHTNALHSSLQLSTDFFARHLSLGAILLLDGVDEVTPDDRPAVRAAIEQLVRDYKESPSGYLVTSRSYAYTGAAQLAEKFIQAEVQPLTPEQRAELINFWFHAIYPNAPDQAATAASDLIHRVETANSSVQELARTPLMATIFAIVHQEGGELPRQRAELYERCVNFLLTEPHKKEDEAGKSLQDWGGVDPTIRRQYISYIAFQLMGLGQRGDAILEDDLIDLLWEQFRTAPNEATARDEALNFVRLVADRGGLLEEQDCQYGFYTHRTFREYLAGRHMGEEMPVEEQRAFLSKVITNDQWEEPIRLAAGYLAIAGTRRPNEFLDLLKTLGQTDEEKGYAVARALQALADLTPQKKSDDRVYPEVRSNLVEMGRQTLETNPPALPVKLRHSIGLALGEASDPRFTSTDINEAIVAPLVPIPAGAFQMGTSPEDEERLKAQDTQVYGDEKPAHTVILSAFEIGKYPVTNAEFRQFWLAEGYEQEELWSDEGWRWRSGEWEPDPSIYPESVRKDYLEWLARRPVEKRAQPFFWEDTQWNIANLPVVGVTWFEAQAYCNWLSKITGDHYGLPSEAQWEKAARGPEGWLWPWGNTWDADKCNTSESEAFLGRTSPVGMYPDGTNPYAALDMVGNVWEWCRDYWSENIYQERAASEVIDPINAEISGARVVRGGSWDNNRSSARCACRYRFEPDYFNYIIGFRLVRSPDFLPRKTG